MSDETAQNKPAQKKEWRLSGGWFKVVLIGHLMMGVGWFGVALAVLALAAIDSPGATEAMLDVVNRLTVPPLALGFAASISGFILALGSKWRVFRHWWVVIKLVLLTLAFNGSMLLLQSPLQSAVDDGATLAGATWRAGLLVAVLATIIIVSVAKPFGRIRKAS